MLIKIRFNDKEMKISSMSNFKKEGKDNFTHNESVGLQGGPEAFPLHPEAFKQMFEKLGCKVIFENDLPEINYTKD
mgnify:CR=1 FL=1